MFTMKFTDMLLDILRCRKKAELLNRKSSLEKGIALFDYYDLTRCGHRYTLSLDVEGIDREVERYVGNEAILRRRIIGDGFLQLFKDLSDGRRVVGEARYRVELALQGFSRVSKTVIEGVFDAYLPLEREAIIVRHTGGRRGDPRPHHIEQAAIAQWLAIESSARVDRVRILYFKGFGRSFEEYIVETKLNTSYTFRRIFRERLIERIKHILSSSGPLWSWECDLCPHADICNKRFSTPTTTPLLSEGEWSSSRDPMLKGLARLFRMVIDDELSLAEYAEEKRSALESIPMIRVGVTDLIYCPIRYWLKSLIPYAEISSSLSPHTLRGEVIHRGIARILSHINECIDIAIKMGVDRVDIEEKLSKVLQVGDILVSISGRCDAYIAYSDGRVKIVELKTVEREPREPQKNHEDQLKIYLNLLGKPGAEGEILYIYTDRDGRLGFKPYRISTPLDEKELRDRLETLINVYLGGADLRRFYAEDCRTRCIFSRICPAILSPGGVGDFKIKSASTGSQKKTGVA